MEKHYNIIIAGAGGIAEAAALILAEWSLITPTIYIGNRTLSKAESVAGWVEKGTAKNVTVKAFHLTPDEITPEMSAIFTQGNIILDCLPGSQAPKIAQIAKDYHLHYANLTEYVDETAQIMTLAKDAETGFVLQTGIAPGYIDVLANHLFQEFCSDFNVNTADKLEFKVGALTKNAVAPHYYGFTWSPIGVATEYLKNANVIRNFSKIELPALSERSSIIINGKTYEDDLTSGGAADLPDALSGKVRDLDYKTLRFPGHYSWVQNQLKNDRFLQKQDKKFRRNHAERNSVNGRRSNNSLRSRGRKRHQRYFKKTRNCQRNSTFASWKTQIKSHTSHNSSSFGTISSIITGTKLKRCYFAKSNRC